MDSTEKEFIQQLLLVFYTEAEEHLQTITSRLIELENITEDSKKNKIIDEIYSIIHTLKGASSAVKMVEMESLCQSLESAFSYLKTIKNLSLSHFNLLHQVIETLNQMLNNAINGQKESTRPEYLLIIQQLEDLENENLASNFPKKKARNHLNSKPSTQKQIPQEKKNQFIHYQSNPFTKGGNSKHLQQVKIPTVRLDELLLKTEEMLSIKLFSNQRIKDLQQIKESLLIWEKEQKKFQNDLIKLLKTPQKTKQEKTTNAYLEKVLSFFDWNQTQLKDFKTSFSTTLHTASQEQFLANQKVDALLLQTKELLMLPFSNILTGFPKMIRDLAQSQNKLIQFEFQENGIEIDKRILDDIKEPILHLLRSSIDHGLERPEERQQKNKPTIGKIEIAIRKCNGNQVEVRISDDGTGIDLEKIKAKAIKIGMLSKEESQQATKAQLLSLIFRAGMSTSPKVTKISGRGIGLTIFQEKIEKLGGSIFVETKPHQGTTFRILLPITIATFRGVFIKIRTQIFALPTTHIEHVLKRSFSSIKEVNGHHILEWNKKIYPIYSLAKLLDLPQRENPKTDSYFILIVKSFQKSVALIVDEILWEQEILFKPLGKQLVTVPNVSGGTILGSGEIAIILNVVDLIRNCLKKKNIIFQRGSEASEKPKEILIVDDSITARLFVKNVLEPAGYIVETASDGLDALQYLKTKKFDLIVSDIEMPNMTGFQLCQEIRASSEHSSLPIILVTSLESEENHQKGIEVGADAYIVKSRFKQNSLLETIQRLV